MSGKACVVGSGPNGLAAAIVLAQHGFQVDVFEAEAQPGGGARTLELTLPGFLHDFGSAVHPLAVGSPFFSSLPLSNYGLAWIHSPCPLAHPFDDGTAITLERDLGEAAIALGRDGKNWRRLMQPFAERWADLSTEVLRPIHILSRHPFLLARFGLVAFPPASLLGRTLFRNERTRALFAGLAAHSFLGLDELLSAAFGVLLGAAAHAVGWPIPRGGAESIAKALCRHLSGLGGTIKSSTRVDTLMSLAEYDLALCDVTPRQLVEMAGSRLSSKYLRQLSKYRYGSGVFKVDYALASPIPWTAAECFRAATFVLLAQPSLFDPTRAPAGKHTAWAYCHVPNGCTVDMLEAIETQIERFAPGFRDCILARRVLSPAALEKMDANLVGGDISGGAMDIRQFLFRPTRRHYATSNQGIYLCSSSTPPGAGVHGMCGFNAANFAISKLRVPAGGTARMRD
jgi:phytoene dehydrogenase-like protein